MSTTSSSPRTFAAAAKMAENVDTDELAALLAEDDNPDVFLGRRRPRRICVRAWLYAFGPHPFVGFDYCDRRGYGQTGSAFPRPAHLAEFAPIFVFRSGRVVRWIRGEA